MTGRDGTVPFPVGWEICAAWESAVLESGGREVRRREAERGRGRTGCADGEAVGRSVGVGDGVDAGEEVIARGLRCPAEIVAFPCSTSGVEEERVGGGEWRRERSLSSSSRGECSHESIMTIFQNCAGRSRSSLIYDWVSPVLGLRAVDETLRVR